MGQPITQNLVQNIDNKFTEDEEAISYKDTLKPLYL